MKSQIFVKTGNLAGKVVYLDEGQRITLGRGSQCDLVVLDAVISRAHCTVANKDGRLCLEDLGSRNGTYVNGQKIAGTRPLASGDEFRLGQTILTCTVDVDQAQVSREPANEMPFELLAPIDDLRSAKPAPVEADLRKRTLDPDMPGISPAKLTALNPAGPARPVRSTVNVPAPQPPSGSGHHPSVGPAGGDRCHRCQRPIAPWEVQENVARQDPQGWICSSCLQPGMIQELGNYRLVAVIGKGQMSTVYRARHARLNKVVALKVLDPSLSSDEQVVLKFLREARAGGLLCHPNVVQLLDAGEFRQTYFIAMEFIDGGPLHQHVSDRKKLSAVETVAILRQISGALEHTESRQMIHRDLKPANIMVDKNGTVKIKDFGRARWLEQSGMVSLTQSTTGPNDMVFMSPEMVYNPGAVDKRSDIYALGALGVYCLTGEPPFPIKNLATLINIIRNEEPVFLRGAAPDVPPNLMEFLRQCMRKDPEQRLQSASEVSEALQAVHASTSRRAAKSRSDQAQEAEAAEFAEHDQEDVMRAKDVQLKLIPASLPDIPSYEFAKYYQPAKAVGGDYFDFFSINDGKYAIVVADVAGKGLAGAMVMVMVRSIFRAIAVAGGSPAQTLVEVNKGLYRDLKRGTFVTAVLAYFDPKADTVRFANAGHNPPLYWDERAGVANFVESHGMALGMSEGPRFSSVLKDTEIKLRKGDMMAFYTDGVVEAMSVEGVEFGTDPLVIAAQAIRQDNAERMVQRIVASVEKHAAGAEQSDDITLFVMKR